MIFLRATILIFTTYYIYSKTFFIWFSRYYKDLISHDEKRTPEDNIRLETTYGILEKILQRNIHLSKSDVFEIIGKFNTNGHEIVNDSLKVIASGLYLGSSAINHSCAPNAHWINRGNKNVLRTLESTVLESVSNAPNLSKKLFFFLFFLHFLKKNNMKSKLRLVSN